MTPEPLTAEWPADAGLRRLHDALTRPSWTRAEAADMLAGVDPDPHRPGDRLPGLWPLLPGIPWPTDYGGHQNLHAGLVETIERIFDLLATHPPRDPTPAAFLRWARERGIVLPWHDAARGCRFCMEAVGAELPDTLSEAQSKKRKGQVERLHGVIAKAVQEVIADYEAQNFTPMRAASSGFLMKAKFVPLVEDKLRARNPDVMPGPKTIGRVVERELRVRNLLPARTRKGSSAEKRTGHSAGLTN